MIYLWVRVKPETMGLAIAGDGWHRAHTVIGKQQSLSVHIEGHGRYTMFWTEVAEYKF